MIALAEKSIAMGKRQVRKIFVVKNLINAGKVQRSEIIKIKNVIISVRCTCGDHLFIGNYKYQRCSAP
jgi:hypothetical protein